jgi:magnesium-transporting ATPase (P-type)
LVPMQRAAGRMTSRPFVGVAEAATRSGAEVLGYLNSAVTGLADDAEAARRRVRVGPNAVRTHRVSAVAVLVRQLRSALLGLLAAAAIVSYFVGEHTDAVVMAVILAVSVGLGLANEYRAERAGAALHDYGPSGVVTVVTDPSNAGMIEEPPGIRPLPPGSRNGCDGAIGGFVRRGGHG